MPNNEESTNTLLNLGPGEGSKVEHIKAESHHLRGQIAQELAQESTHLSDSHVQLVKFHGIYQQENRDARHTRATGEEKAYQFMIRTRIPGGEVTAEQYLTHDDLAGRYANGTLRITTRQGFQLHGILKGGLYPAIHTINEALLSTLAACGDVNRNVMACPVPFAGHVHAQVEETAHRIAMHLAPRSHAYHEIWVDGEQVKIDKYPGGTGDPNVSRGERSAVDPDVSRGERSEETEPIYGPTYLPRKFKIGVAAPGDNCIDVYTQDIGLVASLGRDKSSPYKGEYLEGFTILVGGGLGMTHGKAETFPRLGTPLCFATPDEVLAVVETIVTEQRGPLTNLLTDYGIPTDPAGIGTRRFAMACPALPTCGLALAEAERVLPAVIRQIEADLCALGLVNEPISVRMTGCPNGCARPYMGDIGFVGRTKDVYNVYIGGDLLNTRLNTLYAASVHTKDLAATVRPLLALWKEERLPVEHFGDFCSRVGLEYLRAQVVVHV